MGTIHKDARSGRYIWTGTWRERTIPEKAGFCWDAATACWFTTDVFVAFRLAGYDATGATFANERAFLDMSMATEIPGTWKAPVPEGKELLPYQNVGAFAMTVCNDVLLADPPGLGKTIQAIAARNAELQYPMDKVLVICPAGLRLNWRNEIKAWATEKADVCVVMDGRTPLTGAWLVMSYEQAVARYAELMKMTFARIIIDEAHYLKDEASNRTRKILGHGKRVKGIISRSTRRVFLTGTPAPNRGTELYPILKAVRPDLIGNMTFWQFAGKYAHLRETPFGTVIGKSKNTDELYFRLRAGGFMVRREKSSVLEDLPPKRYKMVVFPQTGETAKVVRKEAPFSAVEIAEHGDPVGSILPTLRREMGEAKAPQVIQYVKDLLDGGAPDVAVYAHHKSVVALLADGLESYGVVVVTGETSLRARQWACDRFQQDPDTRVFVGNKAAGVGITLTAAADVVLAEASTVPGDNEQVEDRAHRITQRAENVTIHLLVVEGSLDAAVLAMAAEKGEDLGLIFDNKNGGF